MRIARVYCECRPLQSVTPDHFGDKPSSECYPINRPFARDVLYPLDRCRMGKIAELRYLREFERSQFLPSEKLQ